jgi:ligand-binding sensor domain-containing protein
MIKRLFHTVSFLVFFLPFLLLSQQIKHLGSYDGIRSGAVRAFEKDSLGYMWIGTSQGLNRYSGYHFKNYDKYIKNGVAGIINKNGHIFILGSKGELLKYNYQKDSFKQILKLKNVKFLSFAIYDHKTIIIGLQQGLLIYDLELNKVSKICLCLIIH